MNADLWNMPTRRQAISLWLRTRLLILWRGMRHLAGARPQRWTRSDELAEAPVLASLHTPLWSDGRADEFVLTAGKVHNLRLAAAAFDGRVVSAGERLGFWRQLGRPTAARGYVPGREIKAGCVVPTVAGGICQISNALATCAVRAGFELVERHAHSARVEAAPEANGMVDATVFWNYVDLQIRAPVAWRLELSLTADELVVSIRAARMPERLRVVEESPSPARPPAVAPVARGCLTCEISDCFRHRPALRGGEARSAWLLDGWTPEFHDWLAAQGGEADRLLPVAARQLPRWLLGRRLPAEGRHWEALPPVTRGQVTRLGWASLRRTWWLRRHAGAAGGRRQASVLDGQRWLAEASMRRLRPGHVHLVVDQGLLPWLQLGGALGGRSYDVLAHALPMEDIQQRLDQAVANGQDDATLADFRAPEALVRAEQEAMRGARQIVTAHAEVAAHWRKHGGPRVRQLAWQLPSVQVSRSPETKPCVVFPASALARKGVHELASALRGLDCRLLVLGTPSSDAELWRGIDVEHARYADDWLSRASVVVLPAHVEHAPRALLMAVAAGIPVLATPACGVQGLPGVRQVPAGDAAALREALEALLDAARDPVNTGMLCA